MQRPLYGLATDLTPSAVVGPVPVMLPAAGLVAVPERAQAVPSEALPSSTTAPPRRRAPPRQHDPARRLTAAAVAVGTLAVTVFIAASRPDPSVLPAGRTAASASAPATSLVVAPFAAVAAAKASAPAQPPAKAKRHSQALTYRPGDPFDSRAEQPDTNLAATVERLRGGIR